MAALTIERKTVEMDVENVIPRTLEIGVKASAVILTGALVCTASGVATKGATATGLIAVGRCERGVDNTGGADSAIRVLVRQGVFKFDNLSTDLCAIADVGADCYVTDDHTVSKGSAGGTKSRAGKIVQVDSDGVFVLLGIGL